MMVRVGMMVRLRLRLRDDGGGEADILFLPKLLGHATNTTCS
jgi:hypothetical protein